MTKIADAIRHVTARVQTELEAGRRSAAIDAHDVVEILLTIADCLDPPFDDPVAPEKRTRYYVATLSTYVMVDALDDTEARTQGEDALQALLNRPVEVRVVRPATPEEVEFQNWADEAEAREPQ